MSSNSTRVQKNLNELYLEILIFGSGQLVYNTTGKPHE